MFIPSNLPDLHCYSIPGAWAGLGPIPGLGWSQLIQPSNKPLIEPPLKPPLSGFPDWDQSRSAPKECGPGPLSSKTLEMLPSPQDLWCWGLQLKLPSWECSLLGPSAGCCGPGWNESGGEGWRFRGKKWGTTPQAVAQAHSAPTHSPGSQVAQGTRGGQEKVPPPCGHFLYYNCTSALVGTSVSLALRSVNDSCPQDMSCGRNCRNKCQTQPAFRKPTATGRFSSHSSWKKQDPNLYPRTRCSASLNTAGMLINMQTRKPVPSLPSGHPQEATDTKGSRAWGRGTPLHSRWKGTLTTPSITQSLNAWKYTIKRG